MITRRDFLTLASINLLALTLPTYAYTDLDSTKKRREELLDFYLNHKQEKIKNQIETIENKKDHYKKAMFFSSVNLPGIPPHPINLEIYGCEGPTIMLPPTLGNIQKIERTIGKYYAKKNFRSVLVGFPVSYGEIIGAGIEKVTSPEKIGNFLDDFNKGYEQVILDHLQVIDWIEQNFSEKKGALGISLGGIITTSLLGLDNRLDSAVLMLAGGNLNKIIAYSNQPVIANLRKKVLEKIEKDQGWLEEKLDGKINLDPINFTQNIDQKKILLITAGNDCTVPTGAELEDKLPNSEKIHLNGLGHESSVLAWPNTKHRIKKFFKNQLT